MSSDLCLGDIAEITMGQSPAGENCNVSGDGLPLLNGPTEFGSKYPHPVQFTTEAKKLAEFGDLLFCVRGSTTGRMNWADQTYVIGRGLAAIRGKNGYPNSYIRAAIESNLESLLIQATGSTFPNVSKDLISGMTIPETSPDEAVLVASILEPIDDRINLLRETNATLEAVAQAMFKSWFVDFDPVHAKQQCRAPEGMDEATAALFPDRFEESELGLVPSSWKIELITEVFDFKEGPGIRNWQYTNSDKGTRFINIRCIQNGDLSIDTANRITNDEANGKYAHFHLKEWDVVVSTSGTLGRSAIVRNEHLPLMLNTSVIRFQPILEKMRFSFLYEYLNSCEFLIKLESMASGSVQKNFGPMHLKQMKLVCPPINILSHYESICRPIFESVVKNRVRIATLSSIRDTLLPRLISGQLSLTKTDKFPEEMH